jgi:hypothetical protein
LKEMSAGEGAAPRETSDLGLPDRMMATRGAILSQRDTVFGVVMASGGSEVERHVPTCINDVVSWRCVEPRRLDGGCELCCMRWEEELSGAVVASMVSLVRGFASV